jgi:hypothetical protein
MKRINAKNVPVRMGVFPPHNLSEPPENMMSERPKIANVLVDCGHLGAMKC